MRDRGGTLITCPTVFKTLTASTIRVQKADRRYFTLFPQDGDATALTPLIEVFKEGRILRLRLRHSVQQGLNRRLVTPQLHLSHEVAHVGLEIVERMGVEQRVQLHDVEDVDSQS